MPEAKINYNSWAIFAIFWGVTTATFIFSWIGDKSVPFVQTSISTLLLMLYFGAAGIIHIKYLVPFWKNKKRFLCIFISILLFAISMKLEGILFGSIYPEQLKNLTAWESILSSLPIYSFFIGVSSFLFFLNKKWMIAVQEKAELKNEKLKAELNLLKAQINPHFLFNTLNNIYFYACSQHPDTPEMIEKLSNILRYIVYDCKEERTPLKKEIESLDNLFSLYKMKNDEQENVVLEKGNYNGSLEIAPLILLNLLENAFKHSDALHNDDGFIKVKTKVEEGDILHFNISNSIKKKQHSKYKSGVGLDNIRKQLDLLYKDRYELKTNIENQVFNLNLNVQLG